LNKTGPKTEGRKPLIPITRLELAKNKAQTPSLHGNSTPCLLSYATEEGEKKQNMRQYDSKYLISEYLDKFSCDVLFTS
jgi:hypothetical protein